MVVVVVMVMVVVVVVVVVFYAVIVVVDTLPVKTALTLLSHQNVPLFSTIMQCICCSLSSIVTAKIY